ncbi:MAG: hypothetical protein U1F87_10130 [Kiritimatiellia bacterium]
MSAAVCLDTSVVMRLLVREPVEQFQIAADFLAKQLAGRRAVRVSDLVLAEAYFALQAFYQIPKSDALEVIRQFVRHSGVVIGASATKVLAIPNLANAKPRFRRPPHTRFRPCGRPYPRHLRKSRPQAPFHQLLQARA